MDLFNNKQKQSFRCECGHVLFPQTTAATNILHAKCHCGRGVAINTDSGKVEWYGDNKSDKKIKRGK